MTHRITVLSGGVGGARFARALDRWNKHHGNPSELTTIVNIGDDFDHLGMRVCPDLDSVTYHLADLGDPVRGWGRANDTSTAITEIQRLLPQQGWFHLGDLDIAHNLLRTHFLATGHSLSETTAFLCRKYGIDLRILPVSNAPSPTEVIFETHTGNVSRKSFQHWWVRDHAEPLPQSFAFPHAQTSRPAPGVLDAITNTDLVLIAPSNPVVSIAPILAIPGVREAVQTTTAPVIGISPILGGQPVRGYADRCLAVLGIACTATAVAEHYGARTEGGIIDGWLMDTVDSHLPTSFSGLLATCPITFHQDERDNWIIDSLFELAH